MVIDLFFSNLRSGSGSRSGSATASQKTRPRIFGLDHPYDPSVFLLQTHGAPCPRRYVLDSRSSKERLRWEYRDETARPLTTGQQGDPGRTGLCGPVTGVKAFKPSSRPGVPREVRVSFLLWLTAVAMGVVETVIRLLYSFSGGPDSSGLLIRVVVYATAVYMIAQMRSGRRWARLTLAVLLGGIGTLSLVIDPISWLATGNSLGEVFAQADFLFVLRRADQSRPSGGGNRGAGIHVPAGRQHLISGRRIRKEADIGVNGAANPGVKGVRWRLGPDQPPSGSNTHRVKVRGDPADHAKATRGRTT